MKTIYHCRKFPMTKQEVPRDSAAWADVGEEGVVDDMLDKKT